MSKEYIEREAIIEQITKAKDNFSPTVRPMFDVFKHIATEAPAADVEPVRHGEWVKTNYMEVKRCSCCNTPINIFKEAHIYCSTCGAKMDGGNE